MALSLTPAALQTYREARAAGYAPRYAAHIARRDDIARRVLSWDYDERGEFYDVDAAELTRATAGPVRHVVLADGTHPDGTITLPPGARCRVRVHDDEHAAWRLDEDDADVYSAEDRAALEAGRWRFAGVEAIIVAQDGTEASESVWGFELGDHWIGTEAGQVWDVADDIIRMALDTLMRTAPNLSAILAESLPTLEA